MTHLCRCAGPSTVGWMLIRDRQVADVSKVLRVAGVIDGPGRAAVEGLRISGWSVTIRQIDADAVEAIEERRAICVVDGEQDEDAALGIACADVWGTDA